MGEFHYHALSRRDWEEELAKIKARRRGHGRHLHRSGTITRKEGNSTGPATATCAFVELAPRARPQGVDQGRTLGACGARYGGIPDWVVDAMPTRGNDPTYLRYVDSLLERSCATAERPVVEGGRPHRRGAARERVQSRRARAGARSTSRTLKRLARQGRFRRSALHRNGLGPAPCIPAGEVTPCRSAATPTSHGRPGPAAAAQGNLCVPFRQPCSRRSRGADGARRTDDRDATSRHAVPRRGIRWRRAGHVPPAARSSPPTTSPRCCPCSWARASISTATTCSTAGRSPMAAHTLEESTTELGAYNDLPDDRLRLPTRRSAHTASSAVPRHRARSTISSQAFGRVLAPMTVRRPAIGRTKDPRRIWIRRGGRFESRRRRLPVLQRLRAAVPTPDRGAGPFTVKLPLGHGDLAAQADRHIVRSAFRRGRSISTWRSRR